MSGSAAQQRQHDEQEQQRELSDRIIVLHNGKLAADGEPAAVIATAVYHATLFPLPVYALPSISAWSPPFQRPRPSSRAPPANTTSLIRSM